MADMIPSIVDGLKETERMVLSLALKKLSAGEEVKVGDLARETFLLNPVYPLHIREAVIVRLAQNFVGTNNINLFEPVGDFGNRHQCTLASQVDTTDLAVRLNPITRLIFVENDDLVALRKLEGCTSCGNPPIWLLPIIPLILVNGCDGTGSWLKSSIPKYKPEDIIANVRRRIAHKELVPMIPWFNGFNGKVELSSVDNTRVIISGVIAQIDHRRMTVTITELPIGLSTSDYLKWLEGQKWLKHYKDLSDGKGTIHLEVTFLDDAWVADEKHLMRKLELVKTFCLRDMHVMHQSGEIDKCEDPLQILEDFVDYRCAFYHNRKDLLLANDNSELMSVEANIRAYAEHMCQCADIVKHWMLKLEHLSEAEKLSDTLSFLNDKLKVTDEVNSEVKDAEDSVATLLERLGCKESKKNGRRKCSSRSGVLVLQPICDSLKQIKVALSKVKDLSGKRINVKRRLDQLQKESHYSFWLKDLDRLELFLKGQCKQDEQAHSNIRKAIAPSSRGRKRKAIFGN